MGNPSADSAANAGSRARGGDSETLERDRSSGDCGDHEDHTSRHATELPKTDGRKSDRPARYGKPDPSTVGDDARPSYRRNPRNLGGAARLAAARAVGGHERQRPVKKRAAIRSRS